MEKAITEVPEKEDTIKKIKEVMEEKYKKLAKRNKLDCVLGILAILSILFMNLWILLEALDALIMFLIAIQLLKRVGPFVDMHFGSRFVLLTALLRIGIYDLLIPLVSSSQIMFVAMILATIFLLILQAITSSKSVIFSATHKNSYDIGAVVEQLDNTDLEQLLEKLNETTFHMTNGLDGKIFMLENHIILTGFTTKSCDAIPLKDVKGIDIKPAKLLSNAKVVFRITLNEGTKIVKLYSNERWELENLVKAMSDFCKSNNIEFNTKVCKFFIK